MYALLLLLFAEAGPVITDHFQDDYIHPGEGFSLKCVASGNPTPRIEWSLDGSPIAPGHTGVSWFVTSDGDVVSHMNITGVQVTDGGQYKCTAVNRVDIASHVATMYVYGEIYIFPCDINRLNC